MQRLLARAALAVNGRCGRGHRKARGEPRVASDVQALLARLADAAEDDVVDHAGLDARACDDFSEDERPEDDWVHVPELSVAASDRCAGGLDDNYFAHFSESSSNEFRSAVSSHGRLPGEPIVFAVDVPIGSC